MILVSSGGGLLPGAGVAELANTPGRGATDTEMTGNVQVWVRRPASGDLRFAA